MSRARPAPRARPGDSPVRARALAAALAACCALGACAVVEAPPGGPLDLTPPRLVAALPESGAVATGPISTLRLSFSEKMTRQPAESWLQLYPPQRIRRTRWHGATEAEIELMEPLPADTVVVVEIAAALQDAHKVKGRASRRFPLATGDSLPVGRLTGALVMGDSAVTNGVVELYAVPPDTVPWQRQPLLRRSVTDHTGRWHFDWLPVPGGPWLVRGFSDGDANLRPGEREAQRLLPDTLALTPARPAREAGLLTLYAHGTPGQLRTAPFDSLGWSGSWGAWPQTVAESDTGWVPAPQPRAARTPRAARLDPGRGSTIDPVPSGNVRVVVFADLDGDSLLGPVPADILRAFGGPAGLPDTLRSPAYLEPWWLVEGLEVPPGLAVGLAVPALPPSVTPWAMADSTGAATALPDSADAPKENR